jgi:hypothetical protein
VESTAGGLLGLLHPSLLLPFLLGTGVPIKLRSPASPLVLSSGARWLGDSAPGSATRRAAMAASALKPYAVALPWSFHAGTNKEEMEGVQG